MDRPRSPRFALSDPTLAARVQRVLMGVVLGLGAIDAAYLRQWDVNPDGMSYIDLARAFAAHGPAAVVNGYWSPLYPMLLGTGLALAHPAHDAVYPLTRAIGFGVFALTTLAFARLVRLVLETPDALPNRKMLPVVTAVAWLLYAVLVLKGIGLFLVTPDMGVAGFVFWASAELVALARRPVARRRWLRLGAVLAVAYWWKAILFPVAGVVLLVAASVAWRRRDDWRGPAASLAAFGALALVLVIPVSVHVGRPTFGETGRLNQLWFVSKAAEIVQSCQPPTPVRASDGMLRDSVLVARPLTCLLPDRWSEATLPMWYDPSTHYREVRAPLDVRATAAAVRRDAGYLRDALGDEAAWLTVAFLVVGVAVLASRSPTGGTWPLLVVAALGTAFYLAVYVELRHVVPFLTIAALAVLAALTARPSRWRVVATVVLAASGALDVYAHVSEPVLVELTILRHELRGDPRPPQRSARVAELLRARGLMEGDRLVTVNALWNVDWAQRAGFLVRAYTPEYTVRFAQTFRELADPCLRAAWEQRLLDARIDAALVFVPPGYHAPPGFEPLEDTGFHLRRLARSAPPGTCPVS